MEFIHEISDLVTLQELHLFSGQTENHGFSKHIIISVFLCLAIMELHIILHLCAIYREVCDTLCGFLGCGWKRRPRNMNGS